MIDRKAIRRDRAGYVPRSTSGEGPGAAAASVGEANIAARRGPQPRQIERASVRPIRRRELMPARAEYRPGVQLLRAHVAVDVTEDLADEYRERAPAAYPTAEQHRARLRR